MTRLAFLKEVLGTSFLAKVSISIWRFWRYLENINIKVKTEVVTILATFENILATFLTTFGNISASFFQHLVTLRRP